ncbi:MAG: SNF2 family N-terminal domain-containing protein [Lentinula lateritia]|nr:MAG: SNF2 family N-terminal domain-containing protein [Lentinula lateritia]
MFLKTVRAFYRIFQVVVQVSSRALNKLHVVAPLVEQLGIKGRSVTFSSSFSDDVKPHPVSITLGENFPGNARHEIGNIAPIEAPDNQTEDESRHQSASNSKAHHPVTLTAKQWEPLSPPALSSTSFGKYFLSAACMLSHIEYSSYSLRLHQAYARQWMENQERHGGNGGIVADEMGLGKTLQMLVLIKDDGLRAIARGEIVRPTLIVGPKSVLVQWDEEIQRVFLPDNGLSCIIYHGPNRDTKYTLSALTESNIVLTTYGILSQEYHSQSSNVHGLFRICWHRLVLDEAHEIRNASTRKAQAVFAIEAKYRWCITGTPLQNKISDLYSLFRLLRIEKFSDIQWFRENIELPIMERNQYAPRAHKLLKVALSNIMLRRLKADNVNGHPIVELPELRVQIWDCNLSTLEREFYGALEARMQSVLESLTNKTERGGIRIHNIPWVFLLRLRQACVHPSLIEPQTLQTKEKGKDDRCPLCSLPFHHSTSHKEACVRIIKMAQDFSRTKPSTKVTVMLKILHEIKARPGNEKTIIFSQYTSVLNLIEPFLHKEDISFSRLDGTMDIRKRKARLNAIKNEGNVAVILVSLTAGGTGLNLGECNNVVLLDLWWNPAVEEQAFARAHRINQTRSVNVYKLVTKDTIEAQIMELQDKKKQLALEALDWDGIQSIRQLSKDEISQIMVVHH